jgi:2-oxoglutarate ferredoxin oxidoreductase subunit beta
MAQHKGTSFIDLLQNCIIFNDKAYEKYTNKETRGDNTILLEHGKPLVFGNNRDKGIRLDGFRPQIVSLDDYSESELIVHDEKSKELAFILGHMNDSPDFPMPLGVFLDIERPTYEDELERHVALAIEKDGAGDLDSLLRNGSTWEIESNGD